jgi:hypothetical protein
MQYFMRIGCTGLVFFLSCGGGSSTSTDSTPTATADTTAPTITSVKDNASNTLSAITTTAIMTTPTSFTIIFSEAMTTSTVSTTNITLNCVGGDSTDIAQTITIAAATDSDTISDNEFTITPSTALPQKDTCTLAVGAAVTDAAANLAKANALAATASYVFTTPCVTSDTFTNGATIVSGGCWTIGDGNTASDGDVDLTSAVSEANGTLTMSVAATTVTETNLIYGFTKTFTSDTTTTVVFDAGEGFDTGGESGDNVQLFLQTSAGGAPAAVCGLVPSQAGGIIALISDAVGGSTTGGTISSTSSFTTASALKFTKAGTTCTCSHSIGNTGTFIDLTPISCDAGSSFVIGVQMSNATGANPLAVTISKITFE